jgi:hypothetical protein
LKFSNCLYDELQACLPLLLLLEKQAIERADVDNSSTQPGIRSVLVVLAGGNNHLLFLQLRKSLIDMEVITIATTALKALPAPQIL